jgi:hypothetical protein
MCNFGFLGSVSVHNSNHHLQFECEVEGGIGPIYKSHARRIGRMWIVVLSDGWRPSHLIKPHSTLTHIWVQLLFLLRTHPEDGKYYYTKNFECYKHKTHLKPER